jgi:hypothetical protein
MAEIIHFSPRKEWNAISNLAGFIRICREDLTVFGADLDWDNDVWKAAGVSFGNLDQRVRRFRPENAMQSPFKEFAKAYLRYEQGLKPTKNQVVLQALKCIERALVETRGAVDVESLTLAVFDRAALVASTHFSRHAAYQVGGRLAAIAKFLSEKRLVSRVLDWKNPLKFPGFMQVRTGAKAREERIKKLPSDEALHGLAAIYAANPTDKRDVFTTATVCMLLCAPSRITEILELPEDCEVWETKTDGGEAYGWRFPSEEGGAAIYQVDSSGNGGSGAGIHTQTP